MKALNRLLFQLNPPLLYHLLHKVQHLVQLWAKPRSKVYNDTFAHPTTLNNTYWNSSLFWSNSQDDFCSHHGNPFGCLVSNTWNTVRKVILQQWTCMVMWNIKLKGMMSRTEYKLVFHPRVKLVTLGWVKRSNIIKFLWKCGDFQWHTFKLALCMLSKFSCFCCHLLNTIRLSNSLAPHQAWHSLGPDLSPNCFQRLSADESKQFGALLVLLTKCFEFLKKSQQTKTKVKCKYFNIILKDEFKVIELVQEMLSLITYATMEC